MKTVTEIIELANTGVNLVIDVSKKTATELTNIINAVINSGGHITLKNCDSKTNTELKNLCVNFSERITLDLT